MKAKEGNDAILVLLKRLIAQKVIEFFLFGEDGVFCYQGNLWTPDVYGLK